MSEQHRNEEEEEKEEEELRRRARGRDRRRRREDMRFLQLTRVFGLYQVFVQAVSALLGLPGG